MHLQNVCIFIFRRKIQKCVARASKVSAVASFNFSSTFERFSELYIFPRGIRAHLITFQPTHLLQMTRQAHDLRDMHAIYVYGEFSKWTHQPANSIARLDAWIRTVMLRMEHSVAF